MTTPTAPGADGRLRSEKCLGEFCRDAEVSERDGYPLTKYEQLALDLRDALAREAAKQERADVLEAMLWDERGRWQETAAKAAAEALENGRRADKAERERDEARVSFREFDEAMAKACAQGNARIAELSARVGRAEAALREAEDTLRLVEHVPFEDPRHGVEVAALGSRIGFGALMASASASWAKRPDCKGGQFVAGPCHATVVATLKEVRDALASPAPAGSGEGTR